MGTRIQWIDEVKGFAILLMVMGHALAWSFVDYNEVCLFHIDAPTEYMKAGLLWQLIYSFHMPLFFCISGYLAYKPTGYGIKFIWNKTKRLLLPYLVTGIIIYLVRGHFGYWFLFSLWELSLLGILVCFCLEKINKTNIVWIDVIVMCVLWQLFRHAINLHYFDNPICEVGKMVSYMPIYFLGILIRKHEKLKDLLISERNYTFYIISFVFLFCLRYLVFLEIDIHIYKKVCGMASLLLPIIGSLMIINVFKYGIFNNQYIGKIFSAIGTRSLEVYILHILFVLQIKSVGEWIIDLDFGSSITLQIVYSILISAIAIMLSMLLSSLLKKSKALSCLLFGI